MKLIPNLAPIDKQAIEELGIPSLLLMEQAGECVAACVTRVIHQHQLQNPTVVVVCGKGNNGGDGFVCARHLVTNQVATVVVVYNGESADMAPDARANFEKLDGLSLSLISELTLDVLEQADVIVDALFGSGLSRDLEGPYATMINQINQASAITVAVDLPSGVHSYSGCVMGTAIQAEYTVTLATAKPGLFIGPGKALSGHVSVVDIGIPSTLIDADPSSVALITPHMVKTSLPPYTPMDHKYTRGHALVIGGSRAMPGAIIMAAEAALRSGVGLVTLAAPNSVFESGLCPPEIIRLPLPETENGELHQDGVTCIQSKLDNVTTVAYGPGLGCTEQTQAFTQTLLALLGQQFEGGLVVDADGLNCVAALKMTFKGLWILTPHIGECVRLLPSMTSQDVQRDLLGASAKLAHQYGATVILKSASSVVTDETGYQWVNPTGNSGMATAGSGDILTGFVASFMAQGLTASHAAQVATYLHGLAGDKAAESLTPYCMTATDLIRYLPQAIQAVEQGEDEGPWT